MKSKNETLNNSAPIAENENALSVVNTILAPHNKGTQNEIIIYQPDSTLRLDVLIENETVWLTQAQMAELFDKDRTVIGRHISNIFKEGELERDITCANFAHMGIDADQQYITVLYNLDMIISVGYRVISRRGILFRRWASKVLKETPQRPICAY